MVLGDSVSVEVTDLCFWRALEAGGTCLPVLIAGSVPVLEAFNPRGFRAGTRERAVSRPGALSAPGTLLSVSARAPCAGPSLSTKKAGGGFGDQGILDVRCLE
jgi:hypothetical protein